MAGKHKTKQKKKQPRKISNSLETWSLNIMLININKNNFMNDVI